MCASVKPVMSQLGTRKADKWPILEVISPQSGQFSHTNYSLEIARHHVRVSAISDAARTIQKICRYCTAAGSEEISRKPSRRAGALRAARREVALALDRADRVRSPGKRRNARGTRAALGAARYARGGASDGGGKAARAFGKRRRPADATENAARDGGPDRAPRARRGRARGECRRGGGAIRGAPPRHPPARRDEGRANAPAARSPARRRRETARERRARARVAAPDLAASRPTADANPAPPPLAELIGAESRAPEGASRAALPRARRRGARPARAPRHPRPLAATRVRSLTIHHPPRAHPSAPRAVAHRPGGGHHPRGRVHAEGDGVQRRSGELLRRPAQGTRAAATRPVGAPRVRPSRRRSKNGGGWRLAATRTRRKSFRRFEEPFWRRSIRYSIARTHDRPSPPKDYENPPSGASTPLRRAARLTLPTPPRAPADPDPTPPPAAPPAAHQGLARYAPDPTNPRTPRTTFPRPKQRDQNRPRNAVVDLSFSSARL